MALTLPTIELLCLEEFEFGESTQGGSFTVEYSMFVLNFFIPGPALHTVNIGVLSSHSDLAQFVPVIRSHFSNVRHLKLGELHLDLATAALWLHEMPHVKFLALIGPHTETQVLEVLASPASQFSLETAGNILCPSLATLVPYLPDYDTIYEVLQMRIELGAPIRTLVLDLSAKDSPEELDCFGGIVALEFEEDFYDSDQEWFGPDPNDFLMEE